MSAATVILAAITLSSQLQVSRVFESRNSTFGNFGSFRSRRNTRFHSGYYDNYLVDNQSRVIVGVQATAARRSQETTQDMLTRFTQWQGRKPESVAAHTTYGYGEFLHWLADRTITSYMPTRDRIHRKNSPF